MKEWISGICINYKEERKWNKSKMMKFYKEEWISSIGITLQEEWKWNRNKLKFPKNELVALVLPFKKNEIIKNKSNNDNFFTQYKQKMCFSIMCKNKHMIVEFLQKRIS